MTADLAGKSLALLCALLWAGAIVYFKRAGETVRPMPLNLFKTAVTALLLAPVVWLADRTLCPAGVARGDILLAAASGMAGIVLADSLYFKALNTLGAGLTAIVSCLYSPTVILLSSLVLGDEADARQIGGAALIISAVLLVSMKAPGGISPGRMLGGLLCGAASVLFNAASIILLKAVLDKAPLFWVMEVRLLASLPFLALLVAVGPGRGAAAILDRGNLKNALPGTFLGNFLAMIAWVAAFKLTSLNSAAILNQTSTIFVLVMAWLFLREPFTARKAGATALAMAGSVLVLL